MRVCESKTSAQLAIIHYAMTLPINDVVNQISRPFYQTLIQRRDWENKLANDFADIYKGFDKLVRNILPFFKEDCANWNGERRWFTMRCRGRVLHIGAVQINCDTCMFNYKPPSWNEINYYLYRLRVSVANQLALTPLSDRFQKVWNER